MHDSCGEVDADVSGSSDDDYLGYISADGNLPKVVPQGA